MPVTVDYVQARWAYSELLSLSQGDNYKDVDALKAKARQGVPFEHLEESERALLVRQLSTVRAGNLLQALKGIANFEVAQWTTNELGSVYVAPYFANEVSGDPAALRTFKDWINADRLMPLNQWHARFAAFDPRLHTDSEPLTVGRYGLRQVLLDGYHRAVRLWCKNDPSAILAVYVPL